MKTEMSCFVSLHSTVRAHLGRSEVLIDIAWRKHERGHWKERNPELMSSQRVVVVYIVCMLASQQISAQLAELNNESVLHNGFGSSDLANRLFGAKIGDYRQGCILEGDSWLMASPSAFRIWKRFHVSHSWSLCPTQLLLQCIKNS